MSTSDVGQSGLATNVQCLCCKAAPSSFKIHYNLPAFDGNFHYVLECNSCHFKFMDPMPDKSWLDNYYRERSIYGGESSSPEDYINAISDKEDLIHDLIFPNIDIANAYNIFAVDFGAGSGCVVKAFDNLGFKSLGLDLNPKSPEKASMLFDVQVRNHGLENLKDSSISIFSMFEVLEHMTDPSDFLKMIRKKMSSKGVLIGTVPNYDGLGRIIYGLKSSVLLQPEHVIYFNRMSLGNLLIKNEFTPIFIGCRKPNHVIIDLGLRRSLLKIFGRNSFSRMLVKVVFIFKKYLFYPLANIFVEKTGRLAHGLTFVAKVG
jgi:SAM-dependent methyltransferase